MNRKFFRLYLLLLTLVAMIYLVGCEADNPPSIFDPNAQGKPAPEITQIIPESRTLAGIGEIKIIGKNFSSVKEENFVFFGKNKVDVLEASATELKLKSPNTPADSISIKIAVRGADLFSNTIKYRLEQAVWEFGGYGEYDDIYAMTMDKDNNLYVAQVTRKVEKVTPAGVRSDYGTMPFIKASGMKMGANGELYLARLTTALYKIPSGGGAAAKWKDAPGKISDFDFSASGMMYAGGNNNDLYRLKPDGSGASVASYPDVNIKAIRVFNGYVYVGGKENATGKPYVWRNQIISDDQLGTREVYFDWSAKIPGTSEVLSITFAKDGTMYLGTDAAEAIVVVNPDGSHSGLYPGVIEPTSYYMVWDNSQYLYVNRRNDLDLTRRRMIKLNMFKEGAPYYGRQ